MDIADRRVATLHFTLKDQEGNTLGTTHGHDPLVHLHGTGGIVPALEQALAGKSAGDRFEVVVDPELGFGPHFPQLVQSVPRSVFSGATTLEVGSRLQATTERGPIPVVVTALDGDNVEVDGNHPLAGKTFTLDVEVLDVRLATPDEIQFGLR